MAQLAEHQVQRCDPVLMHPPPSSPQEAPCADKKIEVTMTDLMKKERLYDAIVVGGGPNGLAAAINLSRRFDSVLLVEGGKTIGGGTRSAALTLPGYTHDICSALQPLAAASPFFQQLDLPRYGLSFIQPEIPLAHPFADGSALCLHRSLSMTAEGLGIDGKAYTRLLEPFVEHHDRLIADILRPVHFPDDPLLMARFSIYGLRSMEGLARSFFRNSKTKALLAGLAAHAMIPLDKPATAAFGMVLAVLAHSVGWPLVRGGSQKLADALAESLRDRGGEIITGKQVHSISDLPEACYYFFDVTPRQLLGIQGLGLSRTYRARLSRFRYGPGVFKMDWALKEPIPWKAEVCRKAGAVHLGSSLEEVQAAIKDTVSGRMPVSPYVIVAQQSLFDDTRAPTGRHTAWAYCHVPHGSMQDASGLIERRIEQFAPGFREVIEARSSMTAADMEHYNPNYVGGDINGGVQDLSQLYTRPIASFSPYRTSQENIFICSSSTPPGGGVHGLCGYYASNDLT
jgi:phytoene dehydrogenase-like protein